MYNSTIKILFLSADPTNASRLRLGQELRDIREKLRLANLRDNFVLEERNSVRPGDISQAILDFSPHIVHFSGHGTSTGELCFEDEQGKVKPVTPRALAALFRLVADQVNCVLLNACYSDIQAQAIAEHISCVVGMKKPIGDEAAIAFAVGFYKALGAGETVERAYGFGCVEIGLENIPEELTPVLRKKKINPPKEFFAYDSSWVGREKLIRELSQKVHDSCRLLLILGLTGIGKTALAERLAVQLQDWFDGDWENRFKRVNFDFQEKSNDFAIVAAKWLEEWGEKLSPEEKKPERLLQRLVKHLRDNQVLVLIDSLERLLTENKEDGWGDFASEWWEKFFLSLLSAESCKSCLIITSQDLPVKLVDSRYKNFWHRQVLYGLEELEQVTLFITSGLDVNLDSPDRNLLLRIGQAYKGHPLVLRVIVGEICESFRGNVQAYWNDVSGKIEEVEKALEEAEADAKKIMGAADEWELHKLTSKVRLEVNKQRLKAVFERLESQVRDAYILICTASVYRLPVQKEGWLMQLAALVKRLEAQDCSKERQERALDELSNRFLAEESINHNNKRVLGQHNLVRSLALEHHKQLLQQLKNEANSA